MIKIDSNREFLLINDSFSKIKTINLKDIGFNNIGNSNLYLYESNEYKILNKRIKPILVFLINIEEDNIFVKLHSISIKNLPNIFRILKVIIELKIFPEDNYCKASRYISLRYISKNKLLTYVSKEISNKLLNNLIEKISKRFDNKLIKKVLKAI